MTMTDVHGNPFEERELPKPQFLSVAIYLVNRSKGGNEEGGWWYDSGHIVECVPEGIEPQNLIKTFSGEQQEEAITWRDILQHILDDGINKGRRPISSVLSTGQYRAEIHEGNPPQHYPLERPHYE